MKLTYVYLAGFLKTLPPNGPFPFNSFLIFGQKIFKVAIRKTKSATIAFFVSSPPFFLLALSFSPFLFLRYGDFVAYRAQKNPCLLTPFVLKWLQISLVWFSKNRLDMIKYKM